MSLNHGKWNVVSNHIFGITVFLSVSGLVVVKSWFNTTFILLSIFCAVRISRDVRFYLCVRNARFWIINISFAIPLVAEMLVQSLRQNFIVSSMDGPARGLLAIPIFIYLSTLDVNRSLRFLGAGAAVGILTAFVSLTLFPEHFWGSRAATYFVDPITLPCLVTVLLGLFLFFGIPGPYPHIERGIKILLTVISIYISILAESRTAWVALLVLGVTYIFFKHDNSCKRLFSGLALIIILCIAFYYGSNTVSKRVGSASETVSIFVKSITGNVDSETLKEALNKTSTGHRLSLAMIDWELLKRHPLLGISNAELRDYPELSTFQGGIITDEVLNIRRLSGSHSEFTSQLVSRGILFGGASLWALFLYPIWVMWLQKRQGDGKLDRRAYALLGAYIPIVFSGLTIQVLNLKMTNSFYVFLLAIFFSLMYVRTEDTRRKPPN